MRLIDTIGIHCSASRPNKRTNAATIKNWHTWPYEKKNGTFRYLGKIYQLESDLPFEVQNKRGNGWSDIGYHYVILTDGTIEDGRPIQRSGAHVKGHNLHSVGICLVGGIDARGNSVANFTKEQLRSLRTLITFIKTAHPIEHIYGHRDFPNVKKDCPCFEVSVWLRNGRMVFSTA